MASTNGILTKVNDDDTSNERTREECNDSEPDRSEVPYFLVNKCGFPINAKTWERMWKFAKNSHVNGKDLIANIPGNSNLDWPKVPAVPSLNPDKYKNACYMISVMQNYMSSLRYNHTGTQFFEIHKLKSMISLAESAREMIRESLPIKCLEAVILGLYLTSGMKSVERFPLSFVTSFNKSVHRHVVLALYHDGLFGALGMSRRDDLMYKSLQYESLMDLIEEYKSCYYKYWHDLKIVAIGLPVTHNLHSFDSICWRYVYLNLESSLPKTIKQEVNKFGRDLRSKLKSSTLERITQLSRQQQLPRAQPLAKLKSKSINNLSSSVNYQIRI